MRCTGEYSECYRRLLFLLVQISISAGGSLTVVIASSKQCAVSTSGLEMGGSIRHKKHGDQGPVLHMSRYMVAGCQR
jgi:hypothetical protein